MSQQNEVMVRRAEPADSAAFLSLVTGLAEYEHLPPPDKAAQQRLLEDAFGDRKRFDVFLAELNGEAAGYAVVFETYSTFLARPKLYLEDLFVHPQFRGAGIGRELFAACLREALGRGCARMEWIVLNWNVPAIHFYQRWGAEYEKSWHIYGISEDLMAQAVTTVRQQWH